MNRSHGKRGRRVERPSEEELERHLDQVHGIELLTPDAYLPGHRRNHAVRLHSEDHEPGSVNHNHPWEG